MWYISFHCIAKWIPALTCTSARTAESHAFVGHSEPSALNNHIKVIPPGRQLRYTDVQLLQLEGPVVLDPQVVESNNVTLSCWLL